MYTEADRVQLRYCLGFGATFLQADPRLENAITATQAVSEGGGRPDSSSESAIKYLVYGRPALPGPPCLPALRGILQTIADIDAMQAQQGALQAGKVRIDSARETIRLRSVGRQKVKALAFALGMRRARADIFSSGSEPFDNGDPFTTSDSPYW